MSELTHPDSKTNDSEVVIGLIGLVGADLGTVQRLLELRLKHAGYSVVPIRVSTDVIPDFVQAENCGSEFERIRKAMDAGDEVRRVAEDNSALAIAAASYIWRKRKQQRSLATTARNTSSPPVSQGLYMLSPTQKARRLTSIEMPLTGS